MVSGVFIQAGTAILGQEGNSYPSSMGGRGQEVPSIPNSFFKVMSILISLIL